MRALLLAMALAAPAAAAAGLPPVAVVGDAVPAPLTGQPGDPARGRALVVGR
jgi:L-cysteine S-thiosulfotransferase